jgi:GntR family transcriptional regulator of arabinose operon
VIHPQRKLGEAVAEKLIDGISSFTAENDDIIFTPELKIRDSVKKL